MIYLFITTFMVSVAVLVYFAANKLTQKKPDSAPPYFRTERLLGKAERSLYGVLKQVVGKHYDIFCKVRVADLLDVKKGLSNSERQIAYNKIQSEHCDFVLCKPGDAGIVAVIELDDRSHNASKRIERDDFIDQTFKEAGIPLLRIKAQATYSGSRIARQLQQALGMTREKKAPKPARQPTQAPTPRPARQPIQAPPPKPARAQPAWKKAAGLCPNCSAPMVKRQAKRGEHAGDYFLACTRYPACKTLIPLKTAPQEKKGRSN